MSDRGPCCCRTLLLLQVEWRAAMDLEEGMNCSLCFTMYLLFLEDFWLLLVLSLSFVFLRVFFFY